ncbi:YicC family protein [Candidatus Dependentiae bacterium]
MFLSMTGFGSKTIVLPISKEKEVSFLIEIKTINSRFFESVCKIPSFLSSHEIKIIKQLKEKLVRGRIYLVVKLVDEFGSLDKIAPSINIIEEYLKSIKVIKNKFKVSGDLNISDLLGLPNIFATKKTDISDKVINNLLKQIDNVIDQVLSSRKQEGKVLQKDLEKRFVKCLTNINEIKTLFKKLMTKQKNKIKKVLSQIEKGDETNKQQLDEMYVVLNKIDIQEEITRFNCHLENVKKVMKDKSSEKGKRIDFILQEILRESNTILAKCSSYNISANAVDIKVELEKIREQVQNIV